MKHSRKIKNFIKQFETFSAYPYQDQAGNWTIGYGRKMASPKEFKMISKETADLFLGEELNRIDSFLNRCINVSLSQRKFDSLVSLAYNIGVWGFYLSTARQRINQKEYHAAAEAILWWNKVTIDGEKVVSGGLVKRRCREVLIFLGDEEQIKGYADED